MKFKILIILLVLALFLPIVHSYADYGINDVNVPQSIKEGEDLNYSITLSNNSAMPKNIDVSVFIIAPTGSIVYTVVPGPYNVAANTTDTFPDTITAADYNFLNSTEPYSIYVSITNEGATGNLANNTYTKYFTVRKSSQKVPVPDMPIVLGIVLAISIVFILARENKSKK